GRADRLGRGLGEGVVPARLRWIQLYAPHDAGRVEHEARLVRRGRAGVLEEVAGAIEVRVQDRAVDARALGPACEGVRRRGRGRGPDGAGEADEADEADEAYRVPEFHAGQSIAGIGLRA